jgi:hypothetical protein
MVRLASMVTLACSTMIVAGTASAADIADSVAQPVAKKSVSNAPMSLRQRVSNWNLGTSVFGDGGCDCIWFNGEWDRYDAQASHEGGAFPQGVKAADDFYLCEGYVYDLDYICGFLCTDSLEQLTKARLELYSDCNGRPDRLLHTFKVFEKTETGIVVDGFRLVKFTFNVEDQIDPLASDNTNRCNTNIVLKGGTYWVSLIGLSDNRCITMPTMCDSSFWATANGGVIRGSVAHKIEGEDTGYPTQFDYSGGSWEPLDECCIGCTDLAFTVCAEKCKILIDNGTNDRDDAGGRRVGERSERSTSPTRNSRAADDFVVNPCHDLRVCYIEGCIYTNCVGFEGWFDIFGNDCKKPSYVLGTSALQSGIATCIVDLGYTVTIDGRAGLTAYRLEFHDLDFVLPRNAQYWISISIRDSFAQNERAYFCYNADCRRECLIRFNPGHVIGAGYQQWTDVGRDFSFLIAGDDADANGTASTPSCQADFNGDGTATLQDLFDFLNSWFAGCP